MIYFNSAVLAKAIELVADETIQADSNQQPIFVEAKRKQKKFILDFFDKINLFDHIRPTVVDLVQYGKIFLNVFRVGVYKSKSKNANAMIVSGCLSRYSGTVLLTSPLTISYFFM